jgi:prefoldin beta subunit
MASSATSSDNPGNVLASAVDAEVAKFRELQEIIQKVRNDYQVVLGQMTENEMVQEELKLVGQESGDGDPVVYKMVGPVLIKQELEDATQTVQKRLEFIQQEQQKLTKKMEEREKQANEIAQKIQQMQTNLQQTTVQAVQAIADQHKQE